MKWWPLHEPLVFNRGIYSRSPKNASKVVNVAVTTEERFMLRPPGSSLPFSFAHKNLPYYVWPMREIRADCSRNPNTAPQKNKNLPTTTWQRITSPLSCQYIPLHTHYHSLHSLSKSIDHLQISHVLGIIIALPWVSHILRMAGSSSSGSPRTPRESNAAKRSRKGCWYFHTSTWANL